MGLVIMVVLQASHTVKMLLNPQRLMLRYKRSYRTDSQAHTPTHTRGEQHDECFRWIFPIRKEFPSTSYESDDAAAH